MVDVTAKPLQLREAVACGEVRLSPETVKLIEQHGLAKGNVLATARVAGILAAKRTGDLIPLCHPLPITHCAVDFEIPPARGDGSLDGGERRRLDHLRHVQGCGQGDADHGDQAAFKDETANLV
jgi:cyclic pyranopterin phosphate synthase